MQSLSEYLEALASDAPTPGGGSAATIVGALGAALVSMVARISSSNKKLTERKDDALDLVRRADELRAAFLLARERDEVAFKRVMAAMALPKVTDAEQELRRSTLESSLRLAAAEPLHASELGLEVLALAKRLLDIPNPNLTSDVGCAAEFGASCVAAAAYNVRINHRFMKDTKAIEAQESILLRHERQANDVLSAVRTALR
jgi:formiminotetrahydrofolate cyclodeaminase